MGLITPDGIRKIIDSEAKFESLKLLRAEVNDLLKNLAQELTGQSWVADSEAVRVVGNARVY